MTAILSEPNPVVAVSSLTVLNADQNIAPSSNATRHREPTITAAQNHPDPRRSPHITG